MNCVAIGLSNADVLLRAGDKTCTHPHYHMSPMYRMACITRAYKNPELIETEAAR